MSEIKAIETVYNGYKFRSRLEARWAVFFDAAGIKYEYEPEGFELSDGTKYLPDFYLKDFNMYAEVKPFDLNRIDEILRTFKFIQRNGAISKIIYLPEIPEIDDDTNEYWYLCAYWSDLFDSAVLQRISICDAKTKAGKKIVDINPWATVEDSMALCIPHINTDNGREYDLTALEVLKYWEALHVSCVRTRKKEIFNDYIIDTKLTTHAYKMARQARFEHGQSPEYNINQAHNANQTKNDTEDKGITKIKNMIPYEGKSEYSKMVLDKYSQSINEIDSPSVRAMLKHSKCCGIISGTKNTIYVGFNGKHSIALIFMQDEERKKCVETAFSKVFNKKMHVEYVQIFDDRQEA